MNKKREKAKQSTEFSLKDHFPDSNPVEPISANWGFKKEYAKEKEWLQDQSEIDQAQQSFKVAKKNLDEITKKDPKNHFLLFSLFKTLNQYEKRIGIAHSNVLQRKDVLKKFNIVSDRFIRENHHISVDYWQLFFEANIDAIINIEAVNKLLNAVKMRDSSFLVPLCKGLCVNGKPNDAIDFLFNYNPCPEGYIHHCLSDIFNYYISIGQTEEMMDLFKKVQERNFTLGNHLGHQLILYIDSIRFNNPESNRKMKSYIFDIKNYLTKGSNSLTQGIYRTMYGFAFRVKDAEMLQQLEKEIILHDYDLNQIKTRVQILSVIENGNEQVLENEFNNAITNNGYLMEYKLLGNVILYYIEKAEKVKNSSIGIHSKDFGLYCGRAFSTQAKALFIRTHVESAVYLRLMELAANNSNNKRAESLLKQMHRRGMNVNNEHYYYVVNALCNRGSVLQCKDIIQDMYKKKIKPSIHIYNRLMRAYLNQKPNRNFTKAFAILEQFPRIWQTPNNETYSIFFEALKDQKTLNSVKFIEILSSINASPSVEVFNHLMLQYSKEKNIEGVIRYFNLLEESSEEKTPETIEILITAYKQAHEFKIMFMTWNHLDRKFKNENGYRHILDAYAFDSDLENFLKEFFELKSLGDLDIQTCEAVLENMISLDVPVIAIDFIMTDMKSMGLIPNHEILQKLLVESANATNVSELKSLKEKKNMLKEFISENSPKIDKLLEKSIIPVAETDKKKLHDNYVEMDLMFASTRRESRRRVRATQNSMKILKGKLFFSQA